MSFKEFVCNELYPFFSVKSVKKEFDIIDGEFIVTGLSSNERIVNHKIRKENLESLNKKGGVKKYLINWIAIALLLEAVRYLIGSALNGWLEFIVTLGNIFTLIVILFLILAHFTITSNKNVD